MSQRDSKNNRRPLRVLLDGFRSKHLVGVAYKLREKGIEIAYWTGTPRRYAYRMALEDKKNFPDTIFHHGLDCIRAIPAQKVNTSRFEPPGRELLHSMLQCESEVLSMMDAVDYSNISASRRKQIYYDYVKYWYGVLTHFKIDAVLFHDMPHTAYDYVIFCLAQKLGIRSVMYSAYQLPDRLFFLRDSLQFEELEQEYQKILSESITLNDLSEDLQEYYLDQTRDKPNTNFHKYFAGGREKELARIMRIIPNVASVVKNIKHLSFPRTAYWYIKILFQKKEIASLDGLVLSWFALRRRYYRWEKIKQGFRNEYEQFITAPDLSKKFVYVPLQVQPEKSTSAQGGVFTNQILMLDILSAALPLGWELYVKEHPAQFVGRRMHLGRFHGYYKKMVGIKNVHLLPINTDSRILIKNAQAVATVTGTSAWEAVLLGTPALMFGASWQMHCDGVFRVSEAGTTRAAFEKIQDGGRPVKEKVIAFLAAIDRTSVRGHERVGRTKTREMSDEEATEHLFNGYYKKLTE